ncbi:MAG: SH3 domain-containing protein [Chloroflexi bacterium]|nr:SH3 domain-containing protein [Chloroflexota bacterium]
MKRAAVSLVVVLTLVFAVPGGWPVSFARAQGVAPWTVAYYNSINLSGPIAYTTTVNAVGIPWTAQAPVPNVGPDFFSARWTSVQPLEAGTYRISTRADDGVRVYVNNQLLINEFHVSSGLTYSADFTVPAGQHTIVVEYYEGDGLAFLSFDLTRIGAEPPPTTGPTATVLAPRLNVRSAPRVVAGNVLTIVTQGQTYPIIGRNADSSWWQINANGVIGWVSGGWIQAQNAANVPITDGGTTPPGPGQFLVTARVNLNIRSGPSTAFPVVGWLPIGRSAQVFGRNANTTWWQVRYGNATGWVSARFAGLQAGVDPGQIPVTDGGAPGPGQPTQFNLVARLNLNIRSGPGVVYPVAGWLPIGGTAQIVGRSPSTGWWQIRYNNVTGWVSGTYTTLQPGTDINQIPITG